MGRTVFASLIALAVAAGLSAEAQTKRAFIAGVGDYEELEDLEKTIGDARGYADVFENELGFEVTLLEDPDRVEFITAFDAFKSTIAPGDDVAFIFSGHGWSDGAENFLVLADAEQDASEFQLSLDTVAVTGTVLENIKSRKPRVTLAIVDACRDYPFSSLTRSGFEKGLVRTEVSEGTMVMYAAGSRQKALDRLSDEDPSPYSVFTRVLLPKLQETDRPLHDIAREVKTEVRSLAEEIDHEQNPAYYDELLGDFCLSGVCREEEAGGPDPDTLAFTAASASVGSEESCKALFNYLDDFPDGKHRNVARVLLTMPECEFLIEPEAVADQEVLADLEFDFDKNFGGMGTDQFEAVAPTEDGGAWLIGYSYDESTLRTDYKGGNRGPGLWAVKVNADGRMVANERLLEGAFITEVSAAPAPGGGAWIAGSFRLSEEEKDEQVVIVKIRADGYVTHDELIDWDGINRPTAAAATEDGGLMVAGTRTDYKTGDTYPIFVLLDQNANPVAETIYTDYKDGRLLGIAPTEDGGAYLVGYRSIVDSVDLLSPQLQRIQIPEAAVTLPRQLPDTRLTVPPRAAPEIVEAAPVQPTEQNTARIQPEVQQQYAELRQRKIRLSTTDSLLLRVSQKGDEIWSRNSEINGNDRAIAVAELAGGGSAIIVRYPPSGAKGSVERTTIVAMGPNKEDRWETEVGRPGETFIETLEALPDGGVLAVGQFTNVGTKTSKSADMPTFTGYAVRLDADGEVVEEFEFGNGNDQIQTSARGPDGKFWIAGFSDSTATDTRDGFVARIELD